MQVLRVVAEAHAGVVTLELAELRAQRERIGCVRVDVHDAHELRTAVGPARTKAAQELAEPVEIAFVAVDELDLELAERTRLPLALEHVDGIHRDVGEWPPVVGDAVAGASRPQRGDRRERPMPKVRGKQAPQVVGRTGRAAGRLELLTSVLARELQLPAGEAVLDASAQREPTAQQRLRRRVVVGRSEEARLERLAEIRRQLERRIRVELQLALERHLHPPILEQRSPPARIPPACPRAVACAPRHPRRAHISRAQREIKHPRKYAGRLVTGVTKRPRSWNGLAASPSGFPCSARPFRHEHLRRSCASRHADEYPARHGAVAGAGADSARPRRRRARAARRAAVTRRRRAGTVGARPSRRARRQGAQPASGARRRTRQARDRALAARCARSAPAHGAHRAVAPAAGARAAARAEAALRFMGKRRHALRHLR